MVQSSHEAGARRSSLVAEMGHGELGDQRLNERRDQLIAVLEQHPDTSFPEMCADDAEVEALYRFLRNPRLSLQTVAEPHFAATHARCVAMGGDVLVIHDTTDMVFAGEAPRAGLAALGKGRQGFWLHTALAVSADGLRAPLGLVSLLPYIRKTQPRGTPKDERARFADPDKESRYWSEGVAAVRTRFGTTVPTIHVMDRAGDSYELFAAWRQYGDRFVVRLNHDRRVVTEGPGRLHHAAPRDAVRGERQVTLSARCVGDRSPKARQQHPPRDGRVATLQFAARPLTLQRPQGRQYTQLPATLSLTVIFVWEVEAPGGEEPIEWQLITTEPIDTLEQVLRVVDWYRARWQIEEFFKALKTGCAYEKRQLESFATLRIALAMLAPVAWQLLLLRHLSRAAPDAAAAAVLSTRQLQVLQATPASSALTRTPTLQAALLAVARLGGHLRQNGQPGWLVLGRGMQTLLLMEAGWAAAERARTM